ncbi:MAG: hypothetical protein PHO44_07550 [Sphaerochaetaceae bacterium]|nr:hypothetical protein [Sphaerochaetaceae bacterium]MDD3163494.1 hypothetical protein [Sphaerochaetaceae bacterium]MDD4007821.1 hypothetical protein [Sphaerochaetaceae bacterium]MDD4397316.1 hypothetical protein [Sphaerochaetaceae bacterium]
MDKQQKKGKKSNNSNNSRKPPLPAAPKMKFTIDSSIYVPKVQEPMTECSICHQSIDNIASAISEPDGGYSHFDCVLKKIADEQHLAEGQKVSYLGRGVFGVIETHDGQFTIINRINYETPESYSKMKDFVESQKK